MLTHDSPHKMMPHKFRRRPLSSPPKRINLLPLVFLASLSIHVEESNTFFCGVSWDDASANCDTSQHCPSGTDDECTTEGHICFGGTLCDASKGDGSKFALASAPYEDISNTRFCGIGWNEALEGCSIETHCPSGFSEQCSDGMSCYGGLACNVQDMLEEQEATANTTNSSSAESIGKDDPRRYQFCGISWADASGTCSQWCPDADDSKCPGGQTCFGDTSCYEELGPTGSPTEPQTAAPTTRAPSPYKDPSNSRFCGVNWGEAVSACSIETNCPSGLDDDCPEGETCHGGTTCNVIDMIEQSKIPEGPTMRPVMPPRTDPSNNMFCGVSWESATQSCSLATHCPDGNCPEGEVCYGGSSTCNAFDMTQSPTTTPTLSPTSGPTQRPTGPTQSPTNGPPTTVAPVIPPTSFPTITAMPTGTPIIFIPEDDIRHSYWCGKDWQDVTDNCIQPCTTGQDTECLNGLTCFAFTSCRPSPKPSTLSASNSTNVTSPSLAPKDDSDNTTEIQNSTIIDPNSTIDSNSTFDLNSTIDPNSTIIDFNSTIINPNSTIDLNSMDTLPGIDDLNSEEALNPADTQNIVDTHNPTDAQNSTDDLNATDTQNPLEISNSIDEDNSTALVNASEISYLVEETNSPISALTPKEVSLTNDDNSTTTASTDFHLVDDQPNSTQIPSAARGTASPILYQETLSPISSLPSAPVTAPASESPSTLTYNTLTEVPSSTITSSQDWTERPTPTSSDSAHETESPSLHPAENKLIEKTLDPTESPSPQIVSGTQNHVPAPSPELVHNVGSILTASKPVISNDVLLYVDAQGRESPTTMYQYEGFLNALSIYSKGLMGSSYFYFGDDNETINYGLANIGLFLAQAAVETVKMNICDDYSWETDLFGRYPLSNSCGQGHLADVSTVPYSEANQCKEEDVDMACTVDPLMEAVAMTNGAWAGAPPPLQCFAKDSTRNVTGSWDSLLACEGFGCDFYEGQVQGDIDPNSAPASNSFDRTDVEGCCWWGRGAFPRGSAGTCNVGKLNYYLGARAGQEGRTSRYDIDFCKDPEAVCRGGSHDEIANSEIRWLMGLQYWINNVQSYEKDAWSYIDSIHQYVDGGLRDDTIFDAISTIVTKGCHDCGEPISKDERRAKFQQIVSIFGGAQVGTMPPSSMNPQSTVANVVSSGTPTYGPSLPSTLAPNTTDTSVPSVSPSYRPSLRPTAHTIFPQYSAPYAAESNARVSVAPTVLSDTPSYAPSMAAEANLTVKEGALPVDELAYRLKYANGYCASSLDDAQKNCASTLKTCNIDDPPCEIGTACFGNVVCLLSGSLFRNESMSSESQLSSPPTAIVTRENSHGPSVHPSNITIVSDVVTVLCGEICLRPLSNNECDASGDSIPSLPDCLSIDLGGVCKHNGECGPNVTVHSCHDQRVFIRVLLDQCSPIEDFGSFDQPAESFQEYAFSALPSSDSTDSSLPSPTNNTSFDLSSKAPQTTDSGSDQFEFEAAWWSSAPQDGSAIKRHTSPLLLAMAAYIFCKMLL